MTGTDVRESLLRAIKECADAAAQGSAEGDVEGAQAADSLAHAYILLNDADAFAS